MLNQDNKKIKMKRMSAFYLMKQKKTTDLIKELQTMEVENQRSKLKKLLSQRKSKWKQLIGQKQLKQPKFNHLKKDYQQFSLIETNASRQHFLDQKCKRKLQNSDRAFSSSPNMKVGNANNLFRNKSQMQDREVLNRKFIEYEKTIDEQSANRRMTELSKINQNMFESTRRKNNMMKKTYFHKFRPDKFNFYSINEYSTIQSSVISRSRTDREMKSRLQYSKIKLINSTIDSSKLRQGSILDRLNRSHLKTNQRESLQGSRSLREGKSRLKNQISDKLVPISLQKNINSIQS